MNFDHPQEIHLFAQKTPKSNSNFPPPLLNFHRKVASSPYSSPIKDPIPTEIPANSPKCHTKGFNFLHSRYHESTEFGSKSSSKIRSPFKKYVKNIQTLNREMQIMSSQLKLANDNITFLTNQLNEVNHKHALHVQEIHERHEQKLTKMKNDIEKLLQMKGINSKNDLQAVIFEKDLEIVELHKIIKENLEKVTNQYEKKLKIKQNEQNLQISTLKKQFVDVIQDLKEKFFNEIEDLQISFKKEMDKTKEVMIKMKEGSSESEGSTALEIENIKEREKGHTSVSDLQIIEEISFQHNLSHDYEDEKNPGDFDVSLRMLINEIGFDGEVSITDILSN
jgi:hypothetical protein